MAIRCFSYSISILNKKAKFLYEKLFSFIIIYSAFWDYFASIPCWFIIYRIFHLHSVIVTSIPCCLFYILELCCLDSMLLVLFSLFTSCILHSGILLPRFYVPYLFTLLAFCILEYVASISSPLFALFI